MGANRTRVKRLRRWLPCLLLLLALIAAPAAQAKFLRWGSNLKAAPKLNTANGASRASGDRSTQHGINPNPHDGADLALWNARLPGAHAVAPRGGQVLAIRIRGCAIEDKSAPSQTSGGTPVNQINFQALKPGAGGYTATATAAGFHLPFCSDSARPSRGHISTSTITTFHPIHLCVTAGYAVGFYDIGGYIGSSSGPAWYPEGVPFDILAPLRGAQAESFADADASGGRYLPGSRPRGANSGWGSEPGEEVLLQVLEGVGGDAYGLCPGGTADEPTNSNRIICAYHPPYDGHRPCGAQSSDTPGRTSFSRS